MQGGFQVAPAGGGAAGQVLRQSVPANACCNFIQSLGGPLAVSILGSATWRNVEVSVDVALATGFAFVGVRSQFVRSFFRGGMPRPAGAFLAVSLTEWQLLLDVTALCGQGVQPCTTWAPCALPDCLLAGSLPPNPTNASTRLTVGALDGTVWAKVNGVALPGVSNFSLPPSAAAKGGAGFVAVGGSFSTIDFDNLAIVSTAATSSPAVAAAPMEGNALRGLPCGDPAAEAGARWALSPGGGAPSSVSLLANASLCLAPSADLRTAVLTACDAAAPGQVWTAGETTVVSVASGLCLGAAGGVYPGSLTLVRLIPCGSVHNNVYFSPDTGYMHLTSRPGGDPLQAVCLGAWVAPPPPPPPPSPPPPQAASFAAAGTGITVPPGGANASWGPCNYVALLDGASSQSFWLNIVNGAQFIDIGFCTPDVPLNIAGPSDWLGFKAGKAWIYRSSGAYHTAAPPPGQGVPYGAAFGEGDFVTAIRRSSTQIEFLVNNASQGMIALPGGIPEGVVGCAALCYPDNGAAATLSAVASTAL